jgi:hypothetical protein
MNKYNKKFNKDNQEEIFKLLGYKMSDIPDSSYNNLKYYTILKETRESVKNLVKVLNDHNINKLSDKILEEKQLELISIEIPNINIIILNSIITNMKNKKDSLIKMRKLYILRLKSEKEIDEIDGQIDEITNEIGKSYELLLYYYDDNIFIHQNINSVVPFDIIIKRYNTLLKYEMNYDYIGYMNGWKKVYDNMITTNVERVPYNLVSWQLTNMSGPIDIPFKTNIKKIRKFYQLNNNLIKEYFEKPRYLNSDNKFNFNETLNFVNSLLKHLTKTFICSNIELIIKKILYEYLSNVNLSTEIYIEEVNFIFNDEIKDYLYKDVPELFVRNGASIYKDEEDEVSANITTVAEILNNLLDLLKTSSSIDIDDYTINLIKNNIITYFDTIVYKIINNWNVLIENIFIYHINHFRILDCFHEILK